VTRTRNQLLSDLNENLDALQSAQQTESLVAGSLLPQAELTLQAALVGYEAGKVDFATALARRAPASAKPSKPASKPRPKARHVWRKSSAFWEKT